MLTTEADFTISDGRPEYSSLKAILYGPYLLAGHTSKDWSITTQAKDGIWISSIPKSGTQEALEATFRLVTADSKGRVSGPEERIGSKVMIEPFDFPNMLMQATDSFLAVQASSSLDQEASRLRLVAGVDGKLGSVSLRLERKKVCFAYSDQTLKAGMKLKLKCDSDATDEKFKQAASFRLSKGMSQYIQPHEFRDERYTEELCVVTIVQL